MLEMEIPNDFNLKKKKKKKTNKQNKRKYLELRKQTF